MTINKAIIETSESDVNMENNCSGKSDVCQECGGETTIRKQVIRGIHAAQACYPTVSEHDMPIAAIFRQCVDCGAERKLPMEILTDEEC